MLALHGLVGGCLYLEKTEEDRRSWRDLPAECGPRDRAHLARPVPGGGGAGGDGLAADVGRMAGARPRPELQVSTLDSQSVPCRPASAAPDRVKVMREMRAMSRPARAASCWPARTRRPTCKTRSRIAA